MNDPPGTPSALGVESVECIREQTGGLTIQVTGRWPRRRRPDWREPPVLLVEAAGRRHRIQPLPEPPSLSGILSGTWRMRFPVPGFLAAQVVSQGQVWLSVGAFVSRLPIPIESLSAVAGPAERVLRTTQPPGGAHAEQAQPAPDAAAPGDPPAPPRDQAPLDPSEDQPPDRVAELERDLGLAREDAERLRAIVAEREAARRAAEQQAYSETALRREVQESAVQREREHRQALGEIAALEGRVRELERELRRARRAVDEASHATQAAETARDRAVRALARALSLRRSERERRLRAEYAIARASPPRPARPPTTAIIGPPPRALQLEVAMLTGRGSLRRELGRQRTLTARAYRAIQEVRDELTALLAAPEAPRADEPAPRAAEPQPPPSARGQPAAPRPAAPAQIDAGRLSDALARLRESASETPAPPRRAVRPWLREVFRNLVVDDPAAAGRLLLALLPAQRAADPQPVSYDLLIAERTCISVTVDSDSTRVHAGADPQPDADFQVRGVPDAVVRLLLAGRLRRAVGWRIARVTGDKRRLAALERLIDPPLTLRDLHAEGVRLDPALALAVIGLMIEPSWTRGEKFTIAHQLAGAPHPDGYLNVPGGSLASVAERPLPDAPTTIVVCSADALVPALAGDHVPELFVRGDPRPLELLAGWLDRAQSA